MLYVSYEDLSPSPPSACRDCRDHTAAVSACRQPAAAETRGPAHSGHQPGAETTTGRGLQSIVNKNVDMSGCLLHRVYSDKMSVDGQWIPQLQILSTLDILEAENKRTQSTVNNKS